MTPEEYMQAVRYKKGSVLDGIRYVPDGKDADCERLCAWPWHDM